MKISIEIITPEIAKEYLKRNVINRQIRKTRVEYYAKQMKSGQWQLNAESIQFDKFGNLLNGQHRLSAIILSGTPVQMVVARDVDATIFDESVTRTKSDNAVMGGISKKLANKSNESLAKLHFVIQVNKFQPITQQEYQDFLFKYQNTLEILDEIRITKSGSCKNQRLSVKSTVILMPCFYAIESGVDPYKIKRFLQVLSTGFYDSQNNESAAIVCRNDILSGVIPTKGGTHERLKSCYMIEKAISDFVEGYSRKISYNNWNKPIYSNNEKFKEDFKWQKL